jgi:hypothetical protein
VATISVSTNSYIRPYRGNHRFRNFEEEASQTYRLGAIVVQDATAKEEVEEAGADPVALILGIAAEAASAVTGTPRLVCMAENGAEFVGHIQDSGTLAAGLIGTNYAVVYDTTNLIWRVDTSDTTNACVTVTELVDPVGDVNGRVAFTFMPSTTGIYKN